MQRTQLMTTHATCLEENGQRTHVVFRGSMNWCSWNRGRTIILFSSLTLILWAVNPALMMKVSAQGKPNTTRVQSERVTLRRTGFNPSQIMRAKGPFVLVVENRSGLTEVSLRIDRVGNNRVQSASLSRKRALWSSLLDLEPGQYALTEANHPNWLCTLTITPH